MQKKKKMNRKKFRENFFSVANIAKSMMYSNIKEATEKYEPRVTVKAITFNASDSHKKLKPTVEVEITGE